MADVRCGGDRSPPALDQPGQEVTETTEQIQPSAAIDKSVGFQFVSAAAALRVERNSQDVDREPDPPDGE